MLEHTPSWEGKTFSGSEDIPRILWNPKDQYLFHQYQSPMSILCQLNQAHAPTSKFLNIDFNITIQYTPAKCNLQLSLLDMITRNILRKR
jgi:hypothetical protein